jgi:hypothetical protein
MDPEIALAWNRFAYALIPLALTLLAIVGAVYLKKGSNLLDERANTFIAAQIRMYAAVAVKSVEQWLSSAEGQQKLEKALELFEGMLETAGIDVPDDQLRTWIEEAVANLKAEIAERTARGQLTSGSWPPAELDLTRAEGGGEIELIQPPV